MINKPAMSETFDDYASMFMEHIMRQFQASRPPHGEIEGRGQVECRKNLPANWPEFLRDNNKTEIFHLLSERVTAETFPSKVVITHGDKVLCSEATNVEWLSQSTHEEANTWMLLHDVDGVKQG